MLLHMHLLLLLIRWVALHHLLLLHWPTVWWVCFNHPSRTFLIVISCGVINKKEQVIRELDYCLSGKLTFSIVLLYGLIITKNI